MISPVDFFLVEFLWKIFFLHLIELIWLVNNGGLDQSRIYGYCHRYCLTFIYWIFAGWGFVDDEVEELVVKRVFLVIGFRDFLFLYLFLSYYFCLFVCCCCFFLNYYFFAPMFDGIEFWPKRQRWRRATVLPPPPPPPPPFCLLLSCSFWARPRPTFA